MNENVNKKFLYDQFDDESVSDEADPLNSLSVEMIDNINDIQDTKNILKLMLHEIQELKASNSPLQTSAPHPSSINTQDTKINKITKMEDFKVFNKKINEDADYRKDLVLMSDSNY